MSQPTDWDALVEDLGPRIFNYMRRQGCDQMASDLTQEVLIRLVEKVQSGQFQEEKGSLTQFAFGIAKYVLLENSKQVQTAELSDGHSQAQWSQDDHISQKQKFSIVRGAILALTPIQQEVINLVLEENLKLDEIGNILNLPVGTVKSHVARAKDKLKETLKAKWEWL